MRQRLVPDPHFLDILCVMALQLLEQIRRTSLYGKEKQPQEVEQWKARVDAQIRRRGADFLHAETGVGGREFRGEEEVDLVRRAHVADEQVGEDASRGVERSSGWLVRGIPVILERREEGGRVTCSEGQVSFGVINIAICSRSVSVSGNPHALCDNRSSR